MRPLFLAVGLLAVVVGTAKADFKDALAGRLSVNPDFLVINLPPRPDAWPGAIFTWNMRIPIKHGDPKDPALRRCTPVAIDATQALDMSAGGKGGYSNLFGLSASAADLANISMSLPDVTVVDMDINELIKHVQGSAEAAEAAKRGQAPVLVIKSYEATPIITVTKKTGVSADAWAKLTKEAQAAVQAQTTSADTISYKGSQPVVCFLAVARG